MKKIIQWLSIPTALVAIFLIADIILPSLQKDQAVITSKFISRGGKSGTTYNIKAEGKFRYNEQVDSNLYRKVNIGDIIDIRLSIFFKELKQINVPRNGKVVSTYRGTDIYYMGLFGIIFLFPLFISYINKKYLSKKVILYGTLGVEVIALIILLRILLVLFGVLPKV